MEQLPELLKIALRARYSFALWVGGLLALTAPLPQFLRLSALVEEYGQWIGVVTTVSFLTWTVEMVLLAWEKFSERRSERAKRDQLLQYLDALSPAERMLLAKAIKVTQQTLVCRMDDPAVSSLVGKGLLIAVPHKSQFNSYPHIIPPTIWKHLNSGKVAWLAELVASDGGNPG
jgi:hypothetical protein